MKIKYFKLNKLNKLYTYTLTRNNTCAYLIVIRKCSTYIKNNDAINLLVVFNIRSIVTYINLIRGVSIRNNLQGAVYEQEGRN